MNENNPNYEILSGPEKRVSVIIRSLEALDSLGL